MATTISTSTKQSTTPGVILDPKVAEKVEAVDWSLDTADDLFKQALATTDPSVRAGLLNGMVRSAREAGVVQSVATAYAIRTATLSGMDGKTAAKYVGVSPATATLAKRLFAALSIGINPTSHPDVWSALSSKGYGTRKEVGAVLFPKEGKGKPTLTKVKAAIKAVEAADSGNGTNQTGGNGGKEKRKTNGANTAPVTPDGNKALLDMIEACLAKIDVKSLTKPQIKRLDEGLAERVAHMLHPADAA